MNEVANKIEIGTPGIGKRAYITTMDNPYDPAAEPDKWFMYDATSGYNTCAYLARIAKTSEELSEKETQDEIERAIDEIIDYEYAGIYVKVYR